MIWRRIPEEGLPCKCGHCCLEVGGGWGAGNWVKDRVRTLGCDLEGDKNEKRAIDLA